MALGAAATPGLLQDIKLLLTAVFTALIVWIVDLAVPVTASYIICAVIAALAGAMENWLFKQTARLERWLLIAAGLALVYPKWLFDYVGVALLAVVVASQMIRKAVGRPLAH